MEQQRDASSRYESNRALWKWQVFAMGPHLCCCPVALTVAIRADFLLSDMLRRRKFLLDC